MIDLTTMDEGEIYELIDELETAKAGLEAMERLGLETMGDIVRMLGDANDRADEIDRVQEEDMRRAYEEAVL